MCSVGTVAVSCCDSVRGALPRVLSKNCQSKKIVNFTVKKKQAAVFPKKNCKINGFAVNCFTVSRIFHGFFIKNCKCYGFLQ